MPAEVIQFAADQTDQEAIIEILEDALTKARSGTVLDVAVITAERDSDGPAFHTAYYGQSAYASLLAGVSALEFDLHYRRYVPEDD